MTNYMAIQPDLHHNAGYSGVSNFNFTAGKTTVPLLKDELPYVVQHMSVAFQKRANGSEEYYELVGLQSLSIDKNLFLLPDGRWLGSYTPAIYRSYPFALLPGKLSNQLQLNIDSECLILEPNENDLRFFTAKNRLTPGLQKIVNFMTESFRSRVATLALCKSLNDANLIVPWSITFAEPDENNKSQEKKLEGLFHIDSDALKTLSAEQLADLNASGALSLAYGQLFSEPRLKGLAQLQTAHRKINQQLPAQNIQEPDLDELFGNKDDLFSF